MSTDEYALVLKGRLTKRSGRNQDCLPLFVGVVYFQNLVGQVGEANGIQSPAVKSTTFPFQVMLAPDVSLKANEVNGFS